MSNPDLPPDSITTLPPDGRLAAIRERYNDMAYSGPTAADRERDTIIGHLLDCLEAAERRVLERDGARATRADGGGRGVSGLDAAIRAKLAEWQQHRRQDGTIPTGYGYDKMHAAITAVLDEHKPRFEPYGYRPGGETVCSAETSVWGEMNQDTPYPCDTVSLIAKALGIKVRP